MPYSIATAKHERPQILTNSIRGPAKEFSMQCNQHSLMGNCNPSRGSGTVSEELTGPKEFSVKWLQDGSGKMRVKLVISKRELQAFLLDRSSKENSLQHVLLLQRPCKVAKEHYFATRRCNSGIATKRCNSGRWKPSLGDIPELN